MAHNSYVRAGGVWNDFTVLLHTECETIDVQLFKSVNGDDGGVWAPTVAITIGGSGLSVTGAFASSGGATFSSGQLLVSSGTFRSNVLADFRLGLAVQGAGVTLETTAPLDVKGTSRLRGTVTADGAVNIGGAASISGGVSFLGSPELYSLTTTNGVIVGEALGVLGTSYYIGLATFDAGITVSAGGLTVTAGTSALHGATHCYSTLTVDGTVTHSGSTVLNGSTNANAPFTANDTVALNGVVTLSAELRQSGDGRVRPRLTTVSSGDHAFGVASASGVISADIVYVPSGVLAGSATYRIANDGASTGSVIELFTEDTTHNITVVQDDGVAYIGTLRDNSTNYRTMKLVFAAGAWRNMGTKNA